MGKKNHKAHIFLIMICFLGLVMIFANCGGGHGGGDATLSEANAGAAASAVAQGLALLDPAISTGDLATASAASKAPLNALVESMMALSGPLHGGLSAQGSEHEEGACSGGGTVSADATWTGPDDAMDPHDMVDLHLTISANNCNEFPYTMNGTISMTFSGPLDIPTGLALSASSFRFADSSYPFDIKMSGFSMSLTDGEVTLNGDIRGSVDTEAVDEGFRNLQIVYGETAEGTTYSISGRLKAQCLGGWVTVSTPVEIFIPSDADCATSGEVDVASGGNTVSVVAASDSSLSVYLNDTLVHTYSDCDELTGVCEVT